MTIARLRPIARARLPPGHRTRRIIRRDRTAADAPALARSRDSADKDYGAELPRFPMKSPAESQRAIVPRPGFRVELVAAEPLLRSPVAIDFDEDGRLYVAEFPEYNQYRTSRNETPAPSRNGLHPPAGGRRRRRHLREEHAVRRRRADGDRGRLLGRRRLRRARRPTCSTSRIPTATARPTCAGSSSPGSAPTSPARGCSTRSAGASTIASTSRPASTAARCAAATARPRRPSRSADTGCSSTRGARPSS